MNILHIAAVSFNKKSGTSVVIPKIVEEQNRLKNTNVALLNYSRNVELTDKQINENYNFDYIPYNKQLKSLEGLSVPFDRPDIVIIHGVYQWRINDLIKEIIKKEIPYILVPHGSITVTAQNQNKIKKQIGNKLFFNSIVKNAKKIQYLSSGEAEASTGWSSNYFVLGNGIDIPKKSNKRNFKNKNNQPININYIGRLDISHKGLDYLLESVNIIKRHLEDNFISINIYGPGKKNNEEKISKYIKENKLDKIVNMMGPIYGIEKEEMFLNTDINILLSRHEGLPTTVLEALSYGIPTLLTPGTNLADEVEKNKCGWKVEADTKEISSKIKQVLINSTEEEIDEYKANATKFVEVNYGWEKISTIALEEYGKIVSLQKTKGKTL
ncbi:glycosyltransferase [Aerococcus viridans]|uniref:Glycosyl transferase family 1 domain-containing protein n=1 Tax=Aerococcus viridans TaxID=1377 RepID=A0A2J9PNP1_9LACT|nr:glycosyltransferase [Aerococcus viridans]PNL91958.1 hypothetical protein A6J77_006845 [Aerococcus viridans]